MGLFGFMKRADINEGVKQFRALPGAVLLDVRTPQEYAEGHIDGSVNLPLQSIETAAAQGWSKDTPLFVHCLSGARSSQAAAALKRMGFANVMNIGGISDYRGPKKKGA